MLLSKQQKHIIHLVQSLGYIRQEQLFRLMGAAFASTQNAISAMLYQLQYSNEDIHLEGDIIKTMRSKVDVHHLEAIDIMLELSDGNITQCVGTLPTPCLLQFSICGEKIKSFTLLDWTADTRNAVQKLVFDRTERIIFLCTNRCPDVALAIPNRHFFAVLKNDGTHHFYEGGNL